MRHHVCIEALRRVVAGVSHQSPSRAPLRLSPGEEVLVGKRDTEWPEFVFVTAGRGEGWVPARYLTDFSGRATVKVGYDTTELSTRTGEVLEVLEEDQVSGWLWCRSAEGREGWVPVKTLKPLT